MRGTRTTQLAKRGHGRARHHIGSLGHIDIPSRPTRPRLILQCAAPTLHQVWLGRTTNQAICTRAPTVMEHGVRGKGRSGPTFEAWETTTLEAAGAAARRVSNTELRVLAALEDLIFELGYAPTYSQMLERLQWKSSGSLHEYLGRLRAKGVIEGRGRSLRVVPGSEQPF